MITGQIVNENRNPEERKDEFWKFCGMIRIVHDNFQDNPRELQ